MDGTATSRATDRRDPVGHRLTWFYGLSAIAVVALAASIWEAIGPFVVSNRFGSLACGTALLGRYTGSAGDAMSGLSYTCLLDARPRRVLTFVVAGVSIVFAFASVLGEPRRGRDNAVGPSRAKVIQLLSITDRLVALAAAGVVTAGALAIWAA